MLHTLLERHWQSPNPVLLLLLRPLSIVFGAIAAHRRARYLSGSLKSEKPPVPVVVVGNIHAGGTGKTPITAALVAALQTRGIAVGIVSRGYGRSLKTPHVLTARSTAAEAGDEPLLLHRRTHAPTAVASRRVEAARALLAVHPEVQLIIADDGLQHYALARDLEICVFPAADAARHDLDVLPNGSLREPIARLREVDAIVFSQAAPPIATAAQQHFRLPPHITLFTSEVHANAPYRYAQPSEKLHAGSLKTNAHCVAIAAIARPQRFFDSLAAQGFPIAQTIALPDHAALNIAALPPADYIFVTEKDAAKLPPPDKAPANIWVLPIEAQITPDLADWVLAQLAADVRQPENPNATEQTIMVKNLRLENGLAAGNIELPQQNQTKQIDIVFDDEANGIENLEQIKPMVAKVEQFFRDADWNKLLFLIAKDVNKACYAQSDYALTASDHAELAQNLQIVHIGAYAADMVVYLYAPLFLPDMNIACQIAYKNQRIENLEIYDKAQA